MSVPQAPLGSQGGLGVGVGTGGLCGAKRGHQDSLLPWGRHRGSFLSPILFPVCLGLTPGRRCPEGLLSAAGFAASLGGAGSVGHLPGALGLPSEWQAGGNRGGRCRRWPGVPLASWGHEAQGQARPTPGAGCRVLTLVTPSPAWRMGRAPAPHSSPRPLKAPLLVRPDPLRSVSCLCCWQGPSSTGFGRPGPEVVRVQSWATTLPSHLLAAKFPALRPLRPPPPLALSHL